MKRVDGADAERVTELFALAFYDDPTWGPWAFPDAGTRLDGHRAMWGLLAHSAVPYGWTFTNDDGGAATMWIPPGASELTPDDASRYEPLLREVLGSHADTVLELSELLEVNHPKDQPHFYLSLFATHPNHRGQGKGMALLGESLAAIDELGLPAYLESSNPANVDRYASVGFRQVAELTAPGGPALACMWRDGAGASQTS